MIHLSARMDMNNAMALSSRRWYSHGLEFSLRIPRSRSGNFYLVFQACSVARAKNVQGLSNLLYTKGLTAGQTGEISEAIYGRDYSRQQVSCLT